jgi:hypothetical protein
MSNEELGPVYMRETLIDIVNGPVFRGYRKRTFDEWLAEIKSLYEIYYESDEGCDTQE